MDILEFSGENRWLSNFWPVQIPGRIGVYGSAEACYQAQKCANPEDRELFIGIGPHEARKLGRQVTVRKDWDAIKVSVMRRILIVKFSNPELRAKLIATTGTLVEGNWWGDRFWGVCRGIGDNRLGKLLMEIRDELRSQANPI